MIHTGSINKQDKDNDWKVSLLIAHRDRFQVNNDPGWIPSHDATDHTVSISSFNDVRFATPITHAEGKM